MLGFPTQPRFTLPFLTLMGVCALVMVIPADYSNTLVFNSSFIVDGQFWRILSGHFVHSNLNHLYLNCAGLLLVWALHGEYYPKYVVFPLVITSSLIIGVGLLLTTNYQNYYGFSAIIHFLLVWGALVDIKENERTGYFLLLGMIAKVAYEQFTGGDPLTAQTIGASVATESHVLGVLTALILFPLWSLAKRRIGLLSK